MSPSSAPRCSNPDGGDRRKDGDAIDVEIVSHTLRFGGRAAALVVMARLRAEPALAESEARKSGMLDAALDAIVAIDHEGRITEFNPAAEHRARRCAMPRPVHQMLVRTSV